MKAEPAVDTTGLTTEQAILKTAKHRFDYCVTALDTIHRDGLEDLMFYDGQQWPEDILRQRNDDRRPSETINKIPPVVHQVTNDMRQNRPQAKVRPVDNMTDPDTAQVVDGLLRNIMTNGDSKNAIDAASFYQVVCGFGYLRILSKYCSEDNFDQELFVDKIENPFSVFAPIDLSNRSDWSDMPYCFVRSFLSKDDFAELYPDVDMTSYDAPQSVGESTFTDKDRISVLEYFEKITERETLYLLADGTTTKELPKGEKAEKEKEIETKKIIWRKLTEHDILEEKDFPGEYIPIVPFLGQEIIVNGEKKYISLTRFLKAPQRMYNYSFNSWIEIMALAPRAPFIAAQGQVEDYEDIWKTANSKNNAYLPYTPVTEAGTLLPPPQRTQPPEAGSSLFKGIELAAEQMKECSGIYDASLGAQGTEQSGKAIIARQREGDTSNFHFIDNQAMSIKHMARIIVNIVPEFYDTTRAVRVLGEDMTDKVVEINKMHPGEDGKLYDMSVGKYDIIIDIGPNYETKRMETAENLTNIMKINPQMATPVMDLLYRSLDFTYAQEAADRMKKIIQNTNPGIIDDKSLSSGKPTEQQVQAMVQDMQKLMQAHQMTMQENQQMQQMIGQLQAALKSKDNEIQVKADGQVLRTQAEIHKADEETKQAAMQAHVDLRTHAINTGLDLLKSYQPQQPQQNTSYNQGPQT